jgi:hypothetical protein
MLSSVRWMIVVSVSILALDGPSSAQTNIFVDSVNGNDNNSGCTQATPKQTLTGIAPDGVFRTILNGTPGCPTGAPYTVWMRAGSTFPGGFTLPAETKLVYWDPLSTGQAVTFSTGGIVISTSTLPAPTSLTATTGLDGSGGAAGTRNFVVDATAGGEGIRVESTGTFTNSCVVRNVRVNHIQTGLLLLNQGGVLAPAITDCTFFTTGANSPGTAGPGSEHVFMENATAGTTTPSLTGCLLEMTSGAALDRGIMANPSAGGGTMSPSISSCTVTGNGAGPDFGILFFKGLGFPTPATINPSIAASTVTDCGDTGIFFDISGTGVTASPTITMTTVRNCGLTMGPVAPTSPWQGNGVAIRVGSGAFVTPDILDSRLEENNYHCLGLFTESGAGSATIGGTVQRCTIRQSGAVTATGDGVRLRTNIVSASGANSAIGTSFDDNNISDNRSDGVAIFTEGVGDGVNYSSVTSAFTNNLIHHNVENGVDLFAMAASNIVPTFTYNTIAFNTSDGWREGPLQQVGTNPLIYNSIIRSNAGPGGNPDVDLVAGGAQIFWSNLTDGPLLFPGNNNNGQIVVVPFVDGAGGNFHLAGPFATGQIVDFAITTPPAAPVLDFDGQGRVFDHPQVPSTPIADKGADEIH